MYKAIVTVLLKKSVLDPQGKTVKSALDSMGYSNVQDVRLGKHMEILVEAGSEQEANTQVKEMCEKLLVNPVIESYNFTLSEEAA
jgi:phosphoribosylformylglycinamidine synthase subunit PurS